MCPESWSSPPLPIRMPCLEKSLCAKGYRGGWRTLAASASPKRRLTQLLWRELPLLGLAAATECRHGDMPTCPAATIEFIFHTVRFVANADRKTKRGVKCSAPWRALVRRV